MWVVLTDLHGRQLPRPFLNVQPPQPDTNGAGGHQNHAVAIPPQPDTSLDNQGKIGDQGLVGLFIADRGGSCVGAREMCELAVYIMAFWPHKPSLMTMVRCRGPFIFFRFFFFVFLMPLSRVEQSWPKQNYNTAICNQINFGNPE